MEEIEIILSLLGTCLGLTITVLTFLVKGRKSIKGKKTAESLLEVCNILMPYITQAEKLVNYSGKEKKEYVLTKANQYAIENGIKFNELEISEKIEELIGFTKEVNLDTKIQEKKWI